MIELTGEDKKMLDKELELRTQRIQEDIKGTRRAADDVEEEARGFFRPLRDFFNAAREYYYNKLPLELRREGDFDTIEIRATITEDFALDLLGVWGCRHLQVKRHPEGFLVKSGDSEEGEIIPTLDQVRKCLVYELLQEHPEIRKLNTEHRLATERLRKTQLKAGVQ